MDKKTRNQKDYDGVIYEPSDYIEPTRVRRTGVSKASGKSQAGGRPAVRSARKPAPKSQFAIFYILTLIAAVTLCIVIFLVVFNSTASSGKKPAETPQQGASPTTVVSEGAVAIEETNMFLGFVQDIVPSSHQVKVLNIESGVVATLEADAKTALSSRYGQTMLFSEFKQGDVVEVVFMTRTNVLKSMAVSSESWEYKQVKDIKVDVVNQSLTYGNETYNFGRGFMVRYKDKSYSVEDIKPMDVCTLRGYKDTVWAIDVTRSHGTLVIIGKDEIVDGLLEINTDVFTMLDAFEPMDVVEGEHRLVIKGTNVEPFVKLVQINPGEVTTVDLAEAQLKSGVLRMNVNESFYTLTIDGEIKSTTEPIVMKYGVYELKVEKDGFEPWEGTVEISAPTVDVSVTLNQIFKLARLKVITEPAGAEIYLDDGFVGISPIDIPIEMGVHTVMPRLDGYVTLTVPVTVNTTTHEMTIDLQPRNISYEP